MNSGKTPNFVELTTDIVSAFVSNNAVQRSDLPSLIHAVHGALAGIEGMSAVKAEEPLVPAVAIKKSVTDEYIICLDDGKKFKSLKRHLRTALNMSPEEYRAKWGLPNDYPMVAPAYAAARSNLAKKIGLGQMRGAAAPAGKRKGK